ncbi:hypothetical protein ACHQM5_006319 [Ranunculus cassubicifolius]
MEKRSSSNASEFVLFLLFDSILNWFAGFQKLFLNSQCFLHSKVDLFFGKSKNKGANYEALSNKISTVQDNGKMSREEVEMVMEKLRIACDQEDEMIHGSNEISDLFEDKEPSVEEVKEAFDVFDVNRDGFVDAGELQRVLCSLGFVQGSKMKECEKMIRVFDENRDGLIDFDEFVKLMESSFF